MDMKQNLNEIEACLSNGENKKELKKGLKQLESCTKSLKDGLSLEYMVKLFSLSLKCTAIFLSLIRILEKSYWKKRRQQNRYNKSLELCKKIAKNLLSQSVDLTISTFITTCNKESYWHFETFCVQSIKKLFNSEEYCRQLINNCLDLIESQIQSSETANLAKSILSTLCCLSNMDIWPNTDLDITLKLVQMHHRSVVDTEDIYPLLYEGLILCLKNILKSAPNEHLFDVINIVLEQVVEKEDISDDIHKKIRIPLQIASMLYEPYIIWKSPNYNTLQNMLLLIASKKSLKCQLGNEVFQYILDCHDNMKQFQSPKIFFLEIKYDITIRNIETVDKQFIVANRKDIQLTFLNSIMYHCDEVHILNSLYASMALIMVEFPSDYTAAVLVCLAMNIQKITLANNNLSHITSYRIHGIVIAILSLVCWVMKANILYKYLNKIVKLRANNAPFLNPPIRDSYQYAKHHVLWKKPEFFFRHWEVRYALWKRFKINEPEILEDSDEYITATTQILNFDSQRQF